MQTLRAVAALLGVGRCRHGGLGASIMAACLGLHACGLRKTIHKIREASCSLAAMCPVPVHARVRNCLGG